MALVSQKKAIDLLRVTGRSVAWRIAKARKLATVVDGKRLKIREDDLNAAIRAENAPPKPRDIGCRPLRLRNA